MGLSGAFTGAACLDENAVMGFIQGRLSPEDARNAEAHVDGCAECRKLVAHITQHFLTQPLDSLEDESETEPDFRTGAVPPSGYVLADRFQLVRVLGRGAMGLVYEANDLQLKVPVALKLLLPELSSEPSFLKHLHREIVVARKITHPNVCRVYDLGTSGDISFISMELVAGETLQRLLARRPLEIPEVTKILDQVCAALDAAHREGVVHRDLKPSNIMLDAQGKVTVMDFGLARDLTGDASQRTGPIGTPAYWAPEQARGEESTYASDLYAVGVIAYEMLTGTRLQRVVREGDALDELPVELEQVVRTCLQLRPERRYDSATALRRALAGVAAAPGAMAGVGRRFVAAVGIAAGFLVAWGVLAFTERRFPEATPPHPVARSEGVRPAPAPAPTPPTPAPAPVAAPAMEPPSAPRPSPAAKPTRKRAPPPKDPRTHIPVFD
jgi:hypothetical protein